MIGAAAATFNAAIGQARMLISLAELKVEAVKVLLANRTLQSAGSAETKWAEVLSKSPYARIADNASIIIILYGALERFIEDLADEFLTNVVKRARSFDEIPEKIQSSHIDASIEYLKLSLGDKYNGRATTQEISRSIYSATELSFQLFFLNEPLLRHTANFRVKIVDDFLSRISITSASRRAAMHELAASYAADVAFAAVGGEHEKLWAGIDELVGLRNEFAHGNLSSSVSTSEMSGYCDLLEVFSLSLCRIVRDDLARILVEKDSATDVGAPIAIYDNSIVCLNTRGAEISGNHLLACKNAHGFSHSLAIHEIQSNGRTVASVPAGEDVSVGIRTDGRCRMNHRIFVVP